ncbi:MAG TPA: excinuclease ABC subunit UvrA, partial [Bacteroidales bacterium]|nr:excinuclease ABC subunit UvrA [Bacteroidales bacterium]
SSTALAMKMGKGIIMILDEETNNINYYSKSLMCPTTGISYNEPEPNTFSFNSPYGACPKCNGLGEISEVDLKKIIPDDNKSIKQGAIEPIGTYKPSWIFKQLEGIGIKFGFTLDTPFKKIPEEAINVILYGSDEIFKFKSEQNGITNIYTLNFEGIVNFITNQINEFSSASMQRWINSFMNKIICPECNGTRLKKESLYFKINDKNIAEVASLDLKAFKQWINNLSEIQNERKKIISYEIIREISERTNFLINIGLDYLTLNRNSAALSGGELQRIRLATQIGSSLTNVLYILDEPSIGLHQRDNLKLIEALKKLRDNKNSIIVIEHDEEMIRSADYVVDMGPGAGIHGGYIVAQGSPYEISKNNTITAQYLNGTKKIELPTTRRKGNGHTLILKGAKGNNLKNIDLRLPLGTFICITGVSGSGKSTLINETLFPALFTKIYKSHKKSLPYDDIIGIEFIDKIIEIDQSPIGKTPRSNPATYTGLMDEIRKLFSMLPESKIRAYAASRFSFNVKGGRCETCKGAGVKTIEMNFLPNVYVTCDSCNGMRYNRETLEIRYKGKSINDVLNMSVENALKFFENIPSITSKLQTLTDVGLNYITLGQQSTTLSGGEAQRVKLATELSKKSTGKTLYILDEPTTGLHFEDVKVLLNVLNRLVTSGNTVVVIEHNMDVIKTADYIIDLGPEGGERGGYIICEGTPEEIIKNNISYTAKYLKKYILQ